MWEGLSVQCGRGFDSILQGSRRAGSYLGGGTNSVGPVSRWAAESASLDVSVCVSPSLFSGSLTSCFFVTGRGVTTTQPQPADSAVSGGPVPLSSPNTCVVTPALGSPPLGLLPIVTSETFNNRASRVSPALSVPHPTTRMGTPQSPAPTPAPVPSDPLGATPAGLSLLGIPLEDFPGETSVREKVGRNPGTGAHLTLNKGQGRAHARPGCRRSGAE